jgi:serine/threonine-protein kinase
VSVELLENPAKSAFHAAEPHDAEQRLRPGMELALTWVVHAASHVNALNRPGWPQAMSEEREGGFIGRVLGRTYRILRPLGRGSMGLVYEAQHLRLYRRVAIKVLPPALVSNPELLARFEHEAELASRIQHRNVVSILDSDVTDEGEPYLVLELLEGETLARRLASTLALPTAEAVAVTMQIALGLAAVHRVDIVHRDLKPENVFLLADADSPASLKLLDFGIGRSLRADRQLTSGAAIVGTPDYMAPEQAAGRRDAIDARTDQFSLAVVAYQMLTGVQPFEHDDLVETLLRVQTLEVPPASRVARWVPAELDPVLARALSKEPSQRYPDVVSFARALAEAAEGSRRSAGISRPGAMIVLRPGSEPPSDASPRTVYLFSRLESGMTVGEAIDVSGMARLEALRRLAQLEDWRVIEVE